MVAGSATAEGCSFSQTLHIYSWVLQEPMTASPAPDLGPNFASLINPQVLI